MHEEDSYDIIGAAIDVHNHWGPGYLESVYHKSLAIALRRRGRDVQCEVPFPLSYMGEDLGCVYRADMICDGILIELKAHSGLTGADEAQIIHYLRCSGLRRGLLLNFGLPALQKRRFVNGWDRPDLWQAPGPHSGHSGNSGLPSSEP